MADSLVRSVTLDIFLCDADADKLPAIRTSIDRYRAACRQMFAVLGLAQSAGATLTERDDLISLKPNGDMSKVALAAALHTGTIAKGDKKKGEGQQYLVNIGAGAAYEMRDYFLTTLYPAALSFVWDSARRQVWSRWTAKDPEFTKAGRGWLVLQGARGLTYFGRVGIEFPQSAARPKLNDRSITLKWDSEIGAVEFQLGKLDPGRWYTWKSIRDGDWEPGTVTLNMRDGRLRVSISYHRPTETKTLDADRVLKAEFQEADGAVSLVLTGPDAEVDAVPLTDLVAKLSQLRRQRETWEARRESAGAPRRRWGNRKAWVAVQDHLSRVTLNRTRFVADQNHALSRRIASRAENWRCGQASVTIPVAKSLAGHSWAWDQLENFVTYKLAEIGAALTMQAATLEEPIGSPRA